MAGDAGVFQHSNSAFEKHSTTNAALREQFDDVVNQFVNKTANIMGVENTGKNAEAFDSLVRGEVYKALERIVGDNETADAAVDSVNNMFEEGTQKISKNISQSTGIE